MHSSHDPAGSDDAPRPACKGRWLTLSENTQQSTLVGMIPTTTKNNNNNLPPPQKKAKDKDHCLAPTAQFFLIAASFCGFFTRPSLIASYPSNIQSLSPGVDQLRKFPELPISRQMLQIKSAISYHHSTLTPTQPIQEQTTAY